MPRLIVLNGPPAIGKSTLARRYVDDHPLALNLDVDRVRDLIGGWRDDPHAAGLLARAIAVAAAAAHLRAGHDVVVPQYLGRPRFLEELEATAEAVGARFHELVLWDEKHGALRRFAERTRAGADPAHLDAAAHLDTQGGPAELSAMHDRLAALLPTRPRAVVVPTRDGDPDQAYRDLLAHLD
ncbi:AAA family ATPase [Jiangella asiatica]|uniref:Uncharacterized protein n=1 Tax=Jiangella asiatica TaxID=2530372 RepID=A0A4R5DXK3_9ACTN|nr:AAA family ATPase [Jiangella asiatica]TDE16065.1 hypothetical protein E1269_01920 [Jiangella asiatica]